MRRWLPLSLTLALLLVSCSDGMRFVAPTAAASSSPIPPTVAPATSPARAAGAATTPMPGGVSDRDAPCLPYRDDRGPQIRAAAFADPMHALVVASGISRGGARSECAYLARTNDGGTTWQ